MLSLVSWQKISITSRESTPYGRKMRAISLAKETLVAWKALQAYFSASAVRDLDLRGSRWSRKEKSSRQRVPARRSSAVPTTTNGGSKKSCDPDPSRRNSGHIAVPTVQPAGSQLGEDRLDDACRPVPGGTVLRTTTAWKPDVGRGGGGHRRADVLEGPSHVGEVGAAVPASTACRRRPARRRPRRAPSPASVVAVRSASLDAARATSSSIPGSTTGLGPCVDRGRPCTASTSTPTPRGPATPDPLP